MGYRDLDLYDPAEPAEPVPAEEPTGDRPPGGRRLRAALLGGVFALVLAVLVGWRLVGVEPERTSSGPAAAAASTSTAEESLPGAKVPTSTPGADPSSTPTSSSTTTGEEDAAQIAAAFVAAWARPDLDGPTWRAGLRPYVSQAFYETLRSVDPANVPATKVTEAPAGQAGSAGAGQWTVGTDAGDVTVSAQLEDGRGWVVTNILPARQVEPD